MARTRRAALSGPDVLSPAQAHRMVQECSAALLDIREADEYRAGHAPGALHVPPARPADGAVVPGGPDGSGLLLICRTDNRFRRAARLPAGRGAASAVVTGGVRVWAEDGLPVTDARGAAGTVI